MPQKTKKGFTLTELVVAMVVLSLAGLILAVCVRTAWNLKTQAAVWQKGNAQLGLNASTLPWEKVTLNLHPTAPNGPSFKDVEASWFSLAALPGMGAVSVNFPKTTDWSALQESGTQAPAQSQPLQDLYSLKVTPPSVTAGLSLNLSQPGNYSTSDQGLGNGGGFLLVDKFEMAQRTTLMITAEAFLLSAPLNAAAGCSVTAAPASGGGQPLLVYLKDARQIAIDNIPTATLAPGWYSVPPGTDLLRASQAQWNSWRLAEESYGLVPDPNEALPQETPEAKALRLLTLTAELDKAYARLILLGGAAG